MQDKDAVERSRLVTISIALSLYNVSRPESRLYAPASILDLCHISSPGDGYLYDTASAQARRRMTGCQDFDAPVARSCVENGAGSRGSSITPVGLQSIFLRYRNAREVARGSRLDRVQKSLQEQANWKVTKEHISGSDGLTRSARYPWRRERAMFEIWRDGARFLGR